MNINDRNLSPLLRKDFIPKETNGKLYFSDKEVKWFAKHQIGQRLNKFIPSLNTTVKIIKNIEVANLSEKEFENVIGNLENLNSRVKRHNESIDKSFLKKALNIFLSIITFGQIGLKYQTLDDKIAAIKAKENEEKKEAEDFILEALKHPEELKNDPDTTLTIMYEFLEYTLSDQAVTNLMALLPHFSDKIPDDKKNKEIEKKFLAQLFDRIKQMNLPQEHINRFLLTLNDQQLELFYNGKSFAQENHIDQSTETSQISEDQIALFERLLRIGHEDAVLDLNNIAALKHRLIEVAEDLISQCSKEPEKLKDPHSAIRMMDLFLKLDLPPETVSKVMKLLPFLPENTPNIYEETEFFISKLFAKVSQMKIPQEEMNHFLLALDDEILRFYFRDRSFVKDNELENLTDPSKASEDQKALLERLFLISHKDTLLGLQKSPILRELLIEKLQKHPEFADRTSLSFKALESALLKIHKLNKFIAADSLLKVLMYVGKNWTAITEGTVGKMSASRPHVRKISPDYVDLPEKVEYDPIKGLVVKLGFLGKGAYKEVNKELRLNSMVMRAISKPHVKHGLDDEEQQKLRNISEREKKAMLAAKGLAHVVQLHEVEEYTSVKKNVEVKLLDTALYDHEDLQKILKKNQLTEKDKFQVAVDVLIGIVGLHSKGILHRDLKPANIFLDAVLVNGEEVAGAIVGDLGLACFMEENDSSRTVLAGTPAYLPPEAFDKEYAADYPLDSWSLGVILHEIFKGPPPLLQAKTIDQVVKIANGYSDTVKNPEPADKTSVDYVIWKLLQPDPAKRMKPVEALAILAPLLAAKKMTVV